MDSYSEHGVRLGKVARHHHHRHHHRTFSPDDMTSRQDHQLDHNQQNIDRPLNFSVANILKPDFGRKAILSIKTPNAQPSTFPSEHTINGTVQRNSPLPRDLSLSSTRLSPQSPHSVSYTTHRERDAFSSHCGLTSPLQKQNGLSRSGSLESLASSRSSVASSSVTGPSSLCSASSTIGGDSLNSDSTAGSTAGAPASQQTGTNGQSQLWPAWVYCTRYSDRPSSGKSCIPLSRPFIAPFRKRHVFIFRVCVFLFERLIRPKRLIVPFFKSSKISGKVKRLRDSSVTSLYIKSVLLKASYLKVSDIADAFETTHNHVSLKSLYTEIPRRKLIMTDAYYEKLIKTE